MPTLDQIHAAVGFATSYSQVAIQNPRFTGLDGKIHPDIGFLVLVRINYPIGDQLRLITEELFNDGLYRF